MNWLRRLLNRLRGKRANPSAVAAYWRGVADDLVAIRAARELPMPATRAILDAMTAEATRELENAAMDADDAAIEKALAEMRVDMQPVTRDLPVYAKCPCETCVVKRMRTGHGEITGRN